MLWRALVRELLQGRLPIAVNFNDLASHKAIGLADGVTEAAAIRPRLPLNDTAVRGVLVHGVTLKTALRQERSVVRVPHLLLRRVRERQLDRRVSVQTLRHR